MEKFAALVLAGGSGTRMGGSIHKQFLEKDGRPLFLISTEKFLKRGMDVVIVTGRADVLKLEDCLQQSELSYEERNRISFCIGGSERWESSLNGLRQLKSQGGADYVLIHDAARPFVSDEVIDGVMETVRKYGTAVAAVPSKDTVKIADADGIVQATPDRRQVYVVQTPQAFRFSLILSAYERMLAEDGDVRGIVTDDAFVAEHYSDVPVRLSAGSYENIKITTPDDLRYLD